MLPRLTDDQRTVALAALHEVASAKRSRALTPAHSAALDGAFRHVLSGYEPTPQGELLVSTFTSTMHQEEPIAGHVLPVILSWHVGIEFNDVAGSTTGALDPEKLWVAWRRGADTTLDTFGRDWDFWSQIERPLADVRTTSATGSRTTTTSPSRRRSRCSR